MTEGVAVEELHKPVEKSYEASENPERYATNHTTLCCFLLLGDGTGLAHHVDKGDQQTSKTDTTERIGGGAFQSTSCSSLWRSTTAKVPGAVDSGNGGMDGVL